MEELKSLINKLFREGELSGDGLCELLTFINQNAKCKCGELSDMKKYISVNYSCLKCTSEEHMRDLKERFDKWGFDD